MLEVKIHVLPGGQMPKRQTEGAIGYDAHIRAIVSANEMDPEHPLLRKCLYDFISPSDDPHVREVDGKKVWMLNPGESALVGIGFRTEMPFPMFYWVAPRSGLSSRYGITVTNAPGTVDPDYRGEAGVLVYNRSDTPFALNHGMRIAQIIFQMAIIPQIIEVSDGNLDNSKRGTGGFGSTGS